MKRLSLIIGGMIVVAIMAFAVAAIAYDTTPTVEFPNANSPVIMYPGVNQHDFIVQGATQEFTLGMKDWTGRCMTKKVEAPTFEEARQMGKETCLMCAVEDLTGQYVSGDVPWRKVPRSETYCYEKK